MDNFTHKYFDVIFHANMKNYIPQLKCCYLRDWIRYTESHSTLPEYLLYNNWQ